jgi:hypothetical protein
MAGRVVEFKPQEKKKPPRRSRNFVYLKISPSKYLLIPLVL